MRHFTITVLILSMLVDFPGIRPALAIEEGKTLQVTKTEEVRTPVRITGFNLLHLMKFTREETLRLADVVPPDMTYRLYGGEESVEYTFEKDREFLDRIIEFMHRSEARSLIVVAEPGYEKQGIREVVELFQDNGVFVEYIQCGNEEYYKPQPNNRWEAFMAWLDPRGYYRKKAEEHVEDNRKFVAYMGDVLQPETELVFNIPVKVNQNGNYHAYVQKIAQLDAFDHYDLHVYPEQYHGNTVKQFNDNLTRLRQILGSGVSFSSFEYYPGWHKGAERFQLNYKNTLDQRGLNDDMLLLFDRLNFKEVVVFHLAGNEESAKWWNSPVFNVYQVYSDRIVNELNLVFPEL